ncbi:MAG: hypothetical protein HKN41_07760 [Ilumatobacter sp.]|nr:hypothetical protein [Ilumatobacter sp.]
MAVTLGAGGIGITHATTSSGERPIYLPIDPCRLADLRPAPDQVGPRSAPLGPAETYTLSGWGAVGDCNLPSDTTALSLNVTAVGATEATFLTIFPGSGTPPLASSLNPFPGEPPIPNAVNVDLDGSGEFSIYNENGSVNVIVDVVGIFDDHNHDDRYYTEDEVDDALAGKDNVEAEASFDSGDGVTGTDEIITSITVDTPVRGFLIVNASTSIFGFAGDASVRCSITLGTSIDTNNNFESEVAANDWQSLAGTRGFELVFVPIAGETTVNLVCDGAGPNILKDSNLTGIFVPDPDAQLTISL